MAVMELLKNFVTNDKHDLAIELKNAEPVLECQNENKQNMPCLIWPKLRDEKFARVNWVPEFPTRLFPVGDFTGMENSFGFFEMGLRDINNNKFSDVDKNTNQQSKLDNMTPEQLLTKPIYNDAVKFIKTKFNWNEPTFRAISRPGFCFMAWYDKKSDASVNELMDTIMNAESLDFEKPRGAVLFFDYWKFAAPKTGKCTLSKLICELYGHVDLLEARCKMGLGGKTGLGGKLDLDAKIDEDEKLPSIINGFAKRLVKERCCLTVAKKSRRKVQECKMCKNFARKVNGGGY